MSFVTIHVEKAAFEIIGPSDVHDLEATGGRSRGLGGTWLREAVRASQLRSR
jgi:hypothetical protein